MLEAIKEEADITYTENGAVTHKTSGSDCLDLFASVGALRNADEDEIVSRFIRAFAEDADTAMKILFFARDVRGGLGERRVFRVILRRLANDKPQSVIKNLPYIAGFGRFDDLLTLLGTPCEDAAVEWIEKQLADDLAAMNDGEKVSLLGKWLPSVNASCGETVRAAKKLAKRLHMTDAAYRKTLTALRKHIRIIENSLREKDYTFDYEKQPSRALHKYRAAFWKNDSGRYSAFLDAVANGSAAYHADALAPYELVEPFLRSWSMWGTGNESAISTKDERSLNTAWNALPDFGGDENALAVIDTSGSMYFNCKPMPAAVALSLGLYFAEHNKGAFRNTFIEFSARPQLITLKGETFADKLRYACTFNEIANTDLEAVFDLLLTAAVKHHVPQSELPAKLVIISDMEFDCCVDNAGADNYRNAADKFAKYGYKLPQIVFWNVASRHRQCPVRMNEQGTALVSGVTPRLFAMIAGNELDPYKLMRETLDNERYAMIAA